MTFFAYDLNVVAVINTSALNFNDVMRFKWHHWLQ